MPYSTRCPPQPKHLANMSNKYENLDEKDEIEMTTSLSDVELGGKFEQKGLLEGDGVDVSGDSEELWKQRKMKEKEALKAIKDREEEQNTKRMTKETIARILNMAKQEKRILTAATVSLLLYSIFSMAIPYLIGDIINAITHPSDGMELLNKTITELILVCILSSIMGFFRAALFTIAGERVVATLRKDLFRAIMRQEVGFFDITRTGELLNRLSSDAQVVQNMATVNISMALRFSLQAVAGLIILFVLSWNLTLVMLSVIPIVAIGSVIYGKFVQKISKQVQDALANSTEVASDSISNIRTVRSFSGEEHEILLMSEAVDESFKLAKKRGFAYGGWSGLIGMISYLSMLAVLYYGATLVLDGQMNAGQLTSFILYTLNVGMSMMVISGLFSEVMKAAGASERIFDILDREPRVSTSGGIELPKIQGYVEFENVEFTYPSRPDIQVLRGLSLKMEPGQVVALVGQSGAGKSTVAHLIERFYEADKGRILVDGEDIRNIDPVWLHRQIALVSQEPILFASTIAQNIAYGRIDATDSEIMKAAEDANALEFINKFEDGIHTLVGERGVRLSGGQKQRIAIARALLVDPQILLLDEATSALDAESEHLVQEALDRLTVGRTTLVIAHRLSTVKDADCVAVLSEGKVVESGTHDELLASDGIYKKLVARQLAGAIEFGLDFNDEVVVEDQPLSV
eukprot:TRINITY_DN2530_c0_g3_i1.p1 TRINITY_DN2530_c0_g3~~TRINITY_DN2530_c0_g3_i1.p1  ORF type:complete len:690 (-),score=220.25 TRINITY_DN2530_c0_g3_i1:771-2840(-)